MNNINVRINELAMLYFDGNNSKMATILSTSEANIRNYRSNREPKIEFLTKIAEYLEINYEWLLTGKGEMCKNVEYTQDSTTNNTDNYKEKYLILLEENKELNKKYIQLMEEKMNNEKNISPAVGAVGSAAAK